MTGAPPAWPTLPPVLVSRARVIRLLALDVDGVLTDGSVWLGPDGAELKRFHVRDGLGIKRAMEAGIEVAWISGRRSEALAARARELGVRELVMGDDGKAAALSAVQRRLGLDASVTAAMGDDLPDLGLFARAALKLTVADAVPEVCAAADWTVPVRGGEAAVRVAVEALLGARRS